MMKLLSHASLIFLLSCLSIPAAIAQDYFPLEKGSEMIYKYGEIYSSMGDMKLVMRVLEEERSIKGKDYLEVESTVITNGKPGSVTSSFARKSDEGWIGFPSEASQKEELMMPFEFEVGETWSTSQGDIEIVEDDGTISTPNGNYSNCMVLKTSTAGTAVLSYYQKGKGLVAINIEQAGKLVLMSYLVE